MGTKYEHLSCEERTMIQLSLEQGSSLRAIARSVDRAPSSISRELQRNGWRNPPAGPRKRGRPPLAGGYRAPLAQRRADRHEWHPGCATTVPCGRRSRASCAVGIRRSRSPAYCGG